MKTKTTTTAPSTWAEIKAAADAMLTAAAPSAKFRPRSTRGLVRVHALGVWIARRDLAAYHATRREVAIMRAGYLAANCREAFASELAAAGGDEPTALSALGINYHDDRGDGLLHVSRMRPAQLAAWRAAAAECGINSRVNLA